MAVVQSSLLGRMELISDPKIGLVADREREIEGSFADILTKSMEATNNTDLNADGTTLDLLTENVDDLSELSQVLIDAQKSELALSLTIQLRNKMLDAYKEITSMQV